MSTTIDEKVVEMRFDNKQFEAGVATSLNTLDRLKKGLDLEGAAKGFDSLNNAASKINLSSLGAAAETVGAKFSAFETIAVGALLKIGSQAVTTGEQLLKSLTIDQITEGWSKYSDKTTAVQTIMAATGKSIDEVNGSLEKLIWFTDETSYSMTDMTSNIGKFTSQGVDLDTAVTAMEGISTWASLSGGSINEASRAMYNLSQALGVGAVKLQDWKSIENANMATKEFKEMAMEAAVATGDLTKSFDAAGNAIYKTSKGTEVTAANFSSTLSDAWFTSDALMGVLNNYGTYADGIYELYNNLGEGVEKTTSEIIADMKSLRGADDQTILSAGYTEDQIDLVRRLSEEVGSIGQKSFAAAQEAKTFEEVITSVKEAVASGWSQTFETVFGNYEQAKVLWTDMANALYEVFAEGGNARNELLSEALSISGFDRFKSVLMETGVEMGAFQEKLSEIADGKGISLDRAIAEYGSLEAAVQNGAISYDLLREASLACGEEIEGISLVKFQRQLDLVLSGVDELSGRQHLISAFWNTWEGVGALLSTVKDAFREIFPAATAEQVYNFAKGLNELTMRFKEFLTDSEEGQKLLADLKNTFQGIFAVLDIVKQAFSGLWRALAPARSEVGGLLTNILGLTGSFGEWLTNLDKAIKENDTFYNAFKKVVDFISGAITTVKNFGAAIGEWLNLPSFSEATESVKSFMAVVKEKIGAPGLEFLKNLFEGLCTRAKQVKDAIVTMKDSIVDSMDKADRAVSGNKLVQVLTGVWNLVKSVASAVSGLLGKAFDRLINSLSNADFNGILDFLNALAAGGLIAALKKFLDPMNELKDTLTGTAGTLKDWVKGLSGGVTKLLDSARGSLEAWQTKLKSEALGKIAAAIAVLSVSLLILASIDSDKIATSLTAITVLFTELSAAMAVLNKLDLDGKSLGRTAGAMVKIGAAMLVLSLAVKTLGELEPEELAKGLLGVGTLLAEMTLFLKTATFDKRAAKAATGMVVFAAAIKILASAAKDLAELTWEELAKGLLGVGVLLAEVDAFLNTAKFSAKAALTAAGMVILSGAIKVLASAAGDFGAMSWESIGKGLAAIGALLVELTAFTGLAGNAKHVIATGIALAEIGAAMKIFASAMGDFGAMSWESVGKGLAAMGGALAEIAVAMRIMPKNMAGMGLGLIAVGASLKIIASALGTMGAMSWESVAKGLVALGGALAELSIALNLMRGTLSGSAALLVAAGAIAILTPALKALGGMSWEAIAKGLVTLAGAFAIIGVAGAVLGPLVPVILGLSAALAVVGVSVLAIGGGLTLIGAGLTSIAVGITSLVGALAAGTAAIVAGLSAIILGVAALIPAIMEKIGEAIVAFCGVIADGAPAIAEAVKAVVLSLIDMLITCVPALADGAMQLVAGVIAALAAYAPQIVDSLTDFLVGVLEGIAGNVPRLIQAAMDVVGAFFSGLLDALGGIDVDSFIKGLEALGLLTGIVAALGLIAGMIPAAMAGAVGLGAVAAELAVIFSILGGLAQLPGVEWLISEGGGLLERLGTAIGGFVGGIFGGFMGGVSASLPKIGADLSAFMTNAQPFIDGVSAIPANLVTGMASLTGAILLLTAADLMEGIASWLTGGSSLAGFGAELVPFGVSMAAFSKTIAGLDADLVGKAAIAGKTLAEMAATIPNSGGVLGFFAGNNDMDGFGRQVVSFGASIVRFGDAVEGLKTSAVQKAAIAGKTLAEMASALPNSGGVLGFFTGNNDMDKFGEQIVSFGYAIKDYAEAVSGINADAIRASARIGSSLAELARTLPQIGAITTADMQGMMSELSGVVAEHADEIAGTATTMMTDVSQTIRNGAEPVKSATQTVASAALGALGSYRAAFQTVGQNVGDGFIRGVRSRVSLAANAGYELGRASLDAAKRALDSHSPSREFIHLGENMGEGLAIGAKNSIVPAAEATSDMIAEVLSMAGGELKSWESWLSEKKYYGQISLKDELAGWEKLQRRYRAGSEERKKIDREVYRVQNELVESTYQASLDWIEEEKYYKRLSTEEELAAYERMQKRYLEGSKERMEIDRKVFTLRNQLTSESYEHSMDWIEEEKYYSRMTLAEELAAYKRVQSRYAKGTDERKKMDREVYRLEQEIYEAQKQYIADVQAVQTEANQRRLDLEEEYADKMKSINAQLEADIKSLNDQYESSLASRTNNLYSAYGLFDEVKEREEISGSKLLDNLQGQVEEFGEWQRTLDKLSARGVDSELIAELQKMGPQAIAQIKALEAMSDSELDRYVGLWAVKHAQARGQAISELEGLRRETEQNIAQLRIDAEQELEEYRSVWQEKMNQIDIDMNAELDQLRADFAKKVGLIKQDTNRETQNMVDAAQKILKEAGWDETGRQIVRGLRSGVENEKSGFLDTLTQMALDAVDAVKETLDIHSPSGVFRELGNFTGLGFVKGLADYAKRSYQAGSELAESARSGLGNAMQTVSDYLNGDMEARPTIRPVLDLSDVANSADAIDGLLYNRRLMELASQTSFAFAANAGESEMTIHVDNNGVVRELRELRGEMAEMTERMAHLQVVLDSGTLVGETAPLMDSALGQRQTFKGRGN